MYMPFCHYVLYRGVEQEQWRKFQVVLTEKLSFSDTSLSLCV